MTKPSTVLIQPLPYIPAPGNVDIVPFDKTKHVYEIEPRIGDQCARMVYASEGKDPDRAEQSAVGFARGFLAEHPELTSVGIYHTHPSPGPVRRYVREVKP